MKCDSCAHKDDCDCKEIFHDFEQRSLEVLRNSRLVSKPDVVGIGEFDGNFTYCQCLVGKTVCCTMEAKCSEYCSN